MTEPAAEEPPAGPSLLERLGPKARTFFRHPLAIALIAGLVAALLVPQFTRQWSDRQKEQEIKQTLLDQISTSSTTAVAQAIALRRGQLRAAGGEAGENPGAVYSVLRNSWQVQRASARSTIVTYFPTLYDCWYSYERVLADYLGLGDRDLGARKARITLIRRHIESNFNKSYVDPASPGGCGTLNALPKAVKDRYLELKAVMALKRGPRTRRRDGWDGLGLPTTTARFRNMYAVLGELLLIGNERIVVSIVETPAENFSHGFSIPGLSAQTP